MPHELLLTHHQPVDASRPASALKTSEVAVFVTKRALITARKDDRFDIDQVVARWDDSPGLAKYGVGFLLYGLLDFVVDGHFVAV